MSAPTTGCTCCPATATWTVTTGVRAGNPTFKIAQHALAPEPAQ